MQHHNNYISQLMQSEDDQLSKLHTIVQNAIEEETLLTNKLSETGEEEKRSYGERLADKVAEFGGSWKFIIIFLIIFLIPFFIFFFYDLIQKVFPIFMLGLRRIF